MAMETRGGKFEKILDDFRTLIDNGRLTPGTRLPTELELAAQYGVSRPSVARALNLLSSEKKVRRVAGAGSFVRAAATETRRILGLLIPGLGTTEIFEPVCAAMASAAGKNGCALLWSGCAKEEPSEMLSAARRYVERGIDGVFFAPLELTVEAESWNRRVLACFEEAGIAVVLLDRDVPPEPDRTMHDLVGVDNAQGGGLIARHLLEQGCRRIFFVMRPYAAATAYARVHGCRLALARAGIPESNLRVHIANPSDPEFVARVMAERPDGVILSNDANAVELLRALPETMRIPEDLRVAGFDDVSYARHLKVPLTTVRQPCEAIGRAAFDVMCRRLEHPRLPMLTVALTPELVVRDSA